jgi:hypothetical protein
MGSSIVGITLGTGWTETANDLYKGVNNAYSTVHGNLEGQGFSLPGGSTRIFNCGAVIVSNGRNAQ